MRDSPVKVLYIAGWGRSGSTLLASILGQIDGFCSVGELRYVWDKGLINDGSCGCGSKLRQCEFWDKVFNSAFGGIDKIDPRRMLALRLRGDRLRQMLRLMISPSYGQKVLKPLMNHYAEAIGKLYRAIQLTAECRVVVDSSKGPCHAYITQMSPEVDLYVVNLVRDPRAVAYSWQRKKADLDRIPPVKHSLMWDITQLTAHRLWKNSPERYLAIRYEDFISRPADTVRQIVRLVGEGLQSLPFVSENEVELLTTHTVAGNPSRFNVGTVALEPDNEWRSRIKTADRLLVTALTSPVLWKCGYRLND